MATVSFVHLLIDGREYLSVPFLSHLLVLGTVLCSILSFASHGFFISKNDYIVFFLTQELFFTMKIQVR